MSISLLVSLIIVVGTLIGGMVAVPKFIARVQKVRREPHIIPLTSLLLNMLSVIALLTVAILINTATISINGQLVLGSSTSVATPAPTHAPANTGVPAPSVPAPGSTTIPTETPPLPGTTLYQTTDFSRWLAQGSWKILNSQLVNDGTSPGFVTSPFEPTSPNVTIRISVKRGTAASVVGLFARVSVRRGGSIGYQTNLGNCIELSRLGGDMIRTNCAQSFPPDPDWHLVEFRLEGSTLSVSIDGQIVIAGSDPQFPGPGEVGIWANGPVIIQNFAVVQA